MSDEATDRLDHLSNVLRRHASTVNAPTVKADRSPPPTEQPISIVLGDHSYVLKATVEEIKRLRGELETLKTKQALNNADVNRMQWWVGFSLIFSGVVIVVAALAAAFAFWLQLGRLLMV